MLVIAWSWCFFECCLTVLKYSATNIYLALAVQLHQLLCWRCLRNVVVVCFELSILTKGVMYVSRSTLDGSHGSCATPGLTVIANYYKSPRAFLLKFHWYLCVKDTVGRDVHLHLSTSIESIFHCYVCMYGSVMCVTIICSETAPYCVLFLFQPVLWLLYVWVQCDSNRFGGWQTKVGIKSYSVT